MTRSRLGKTLPILLFALWVPSFGLALPTSQDEPEEGEASEVAGPGDPQNHLAATVGEWEMTIRVWTNPNGEPAETRGSASAR